MKEEHAENDEKISRALKQFPYFKGWHGSLLLDLYNNSFVRCFQREDLILGFGEGSSDHVYFILRGECAMLQLINRARDKTNQNKTNKYAKLAEICIFLRGATFNVGEDMDGRCVVARSLVVWCLQLPRSILLAQGNADNVWTRLKLLLQARLPSPQELTLLMRKQLLWNQQNQKLTYDILRKSKI